MAYSELILDVAACAPGTGEGYFIAGKKDERCQVLLGGPGAYTHVCMVPRRLREASLERVQGYCRNLETPAIVHELLSPSLPIAIVATILLTLFIRVLVSEATERGSFAPHSAPPNSKRDLRFANLERSEP